jgi:hypothetical protein
MKHLGLIFTTALVVGLGAGSCTDSTYYGPPNGGYLTCDQLTTCGSCTEIIGCGWCTIGNSGVCVSEPNACWRAPMFTWSWEPSACPGADAGAEDARSRDAMSNDAMSSDASSAD